MPKACRVCLDLLAAVAVKSRLKDWSMPIIEPEFRLLKFQWLTMLLILVN